MSILAIMLAKLFNSECSVSLSKNAFFGIVKLQKRFSIETTTKKFFLVTCEMSNSTL